MARRGRHKLDDGASVAEHARRLRARPGWDPARCPTAERAELGRALDLLRTGEALDQAEACAACAQARQDGGDPGALCQAHLARALGL